MTELTELAMWRGLTPILLGVIGFFLYDLHKRIGDEMSKQKDEMSALRAEINALQQSLPLNYVLREDFIRAQASMDNKLDRLLERIRKED